MTNKEAIEELESLIEHYSSFVEHKHHEPWDSDIEALKLAIKALIFIEENYPKTFDDYVKGVMK